MNCSVFSKSLKDFIAGELFEENDDMMAKHMNNCEKCKKLYDDQNTVYQSINSMAFIKNTTFSSSREGILGMIDKTRYSKKVINKINFFMKKNSLRYAIGSVAVIAIMFFGFFSVNHFKDLNLARILPSWAYTDNISTADGENVIRNFVTTYYSVNQNDLDFYKKATITGFNDSELADLNNIYETNNKKFKQYLSDKSYKYFVATRLCTGRIMKAYKNNIFIEIKNLKISKINEDKKANTIGYHYEVQLNQINKDTKKTEIVKVTGSLTVINQNGNWKIVDVIN